MTLKFLYMKLVGLLMVTCGFGYSLTSIYNFFDTVLGSKIIDANANIWIMSIGLIFPLYIFIFGVFFYFYADVYKNEKSNVVLFSSLGVIIIGVLRYLLEQRMIVKYFFVLKDLMKFTHISFAYVVLMLGVLLIYGRIKYKY